MMGMVRKKWFRQSFIVSLLYLTVVSLGFFVAGAISNKNIEYWYLAWNLFLAWIPVILVLGLVRLLKRHAWSSWPCLGLTFLWLVFLPNSFYMISDFLHIQDYQRVDVVYDTVMFSSFILTSLLLGYTSLFLIHRELLKRVRALPAWLLVAGIVLLCSFAIYLGRDLRWNTWDVLTSPAGILFDISEIVLDPWSHFIAFTTTLTFFIFLGSLYIAGWQLVTSLRPDEPVQTSVER